MGADSPILELQRLDSSADELRARRGGLAERALLHECEAELAALARARDEALARRAALRREERRVDALVADLEARARVVESTLYSGKVRATRELEALQRELVSFQRVQREQEDAELAVLEEEETLDAELSHMETRRSELERQAATLRAAVAAEEGKIDVELERIGEMRGAMLPGVSASWLAIYEKLRALPRLAGRVAVPLERGACSGCRMALPLLLTSRLQREPTSGIDRCPHCTRIVVYLGPG